MEVKVMHVPIAFTHVILTQKVRVCKTDVGIYILHSNVCRMFVVL